MHLGSETAESHVEPSKAHPESSLWADPPAPCPLHPQLQFQSSGPLSFPPHALHILSTTLLPVPPARYITDGRTEAEEVFGEQAISLH